jgi:hypothetical protein
MRSCSCAARPTRLLRFPALRRYAPQRQPSEGRRPAPPEVAAQNRRSKVNEPKAVNVPPATPEAYPLEGLPLEAAFLEITEDVHS